jgi:hypothetical protein
MPPGSFRRGPIAIIIVALLPYGTRVRLSERF